jgi:hypothetical protein
MSRLGALVALCLGIALFAPVARATEVCGHDMNLSSPQDKALLDFAYRMKLAQPVAFKNIADYLHADHGQALPPCYLAKSRAERAGWHRGEDLWAVAPGDSIGGDRYADREHRLPAEWRGRYVEADLDYAGGHRSIRRLIFVRGMGATEWLIFVSVDHERNFALFVPAPESP